MNISITDEDNLKEEAIRQIIVLGCSIEDVARSTGICEMTLYRWTHEQIWLSSEKRR